MSSTDQLPTTDVGGETTKEVVLEAGEKDLPVESGGRPSTGTDRRRKRVEFGSLVTGVELSVAMKGFGLAIWRSAANRDGFVFNIERFGLRVALLLLAGWLGEIIWKSTSTTCCAGLPLLVFDLHHGIIFQTSWKRFLLAPLRHSLHKHPSYR